MTTEPTDFDLDDDSDPDAIPGESNDIRNLRKQAKDAKRLQKENEALQAQSRELAFYRAGLTADDLSTPIGVLFARAYDGPLEAEAIKAAFGELGGTPAAPETPEISPEEAASSRERQNLAAGATGDTGTTPPQPVTGPEGEAVRTGRTTLESGGGRDDAMATVFARLASAAAEGDQSVIVPFGGQRE